MFAASAAPAWVRAGAKYDFDFANDRYWGGSVSKFNGYGNNTSFQPQLLLVGPNIYYPIYYPDRTGLLVTNNNSPSPSITAGMGLWGIGTFVAEALYNRDFTNAAWIKTNMTAARTTGADGVLNSGSLLTATAAGGNVSQVITLASAAFVNWVYLKRVTGTGAVTLTLDGTTFTDVTAQLNATGYTWVSIPSQTLANPQFGLTLATSGDAVAIDFAMLGGSVVAGIASRGVLATTSAALTNYNVEPTLGTLNGRSASQPLINDIMNGARPYSFAGELTGTPTGAAGCLMASDGDINTTSGCDGGTFSAFSAVTTNTGNAGFGNWNKVAAKRAPQNGISKCCMNGGPIAMSASSSSFNTSGTHIGIANNGSGGTPTLNGCVRRLTFWNYEIPDGQLLELTR